MVMSVCVTPNGQNIVSGSYDDTVRIWSFAIGKLVRMLADGEKIYAHLPVGAPPAADSVDAPTYLEYRMPSDRRDEVRRLGACWDAIRSRYYVPAGVGLVAFEGWRERPPRREGQC